MNMNVKLDASSFWRKRRVLVTGHTGFKGSWLATWLLKLGADVSGYALAPTLSDIPQGYQSFFDELGLATQMTHQIGDIREADKLQAAVQTCDPEIVFHMAAQPLVRRSYADPVETYSTNVMGTVNLLEACRKGAPSLRCIIVISSDKCYENREQIWAYRETDAMGGHDPYSASKGCTELVTASYRNSYFPIGRIAEHGVCLASVRAGNVIGGGDWCTDRLIPDAMRAFAAESPLRLRYPSACRPWQHVLEPLGGYMRLAERSFQDPKLCAQGWNFGPSDQSTLTVEEIINQLATRLGPKFRWTIDPGETVHEANLLKLDCSMARQHLGWSAGLDARQMTDLTAEWYAGATPEIRMQCVVRQISEYQTLLNSCDAGISAKRCPIER